MLLENNSGAGNNWAGIRLKGASANRDDIGSLINWSLGQSSKRMERFDAVPKGRYTLLEES